MSVLCCLMILNLVPLQGGQDIMSVMSHLVKSQRTEVTEKLRREVDRVVKGYVDQGVAEIVPGVVFIDEVSVILYVRITSRVCRVDLITPTHFRCTCSTSNASPT